MKRKTPTYEVQKLVALRGKLPSGVRVGRVWVTLHRYKNRAVAESALRGERIDDRDAMIRIVVK